MQAGNEFQQEGCGGFAFQCNGAATGAVFSSRLDGFSRRSSEVLLNKIESIHVQQGLLGRKFNYGNIVVTGTGGSREVLAEIEKPFDFYRLLQEQPVAAKAEGRAG